MASHEGGRRSNCATRTPHTHPNTHPNAHPNARRRLWVMAGGGGGGRLNGAPASANLSRSADAAWGVDEARRQPFEGPR